MPDLISVDVRSFGMQKPPEQVEFCKDDARLISALTLLNQSSSSNSKKISRMTINRSSSKRRDSRRLRQSDIRSPPDPSRLSLEYEDAPATGPGACSLYEISGILISTSRPLTAERIRPSMMA